MPDVTDDIQNDCLHSDQSMHEYLLKPPNPKIQRSTIMCWTKRHDPTKWLSQEMCIWIYSVISTNCIGEFIWLQNCAARFACLPAVLFRGAGGLHKGGATAMLGGLRRRGRREGETICSCESGTVKWLGAVWRLATLVQFAPITPSLFHSCRGIAGSLRCKSGNSAAPRWLGYTLH